MVRFPLRHKVLVVFKYLLLMAAGCFCGLCLTLGSASLVHPWGKTLPLFLPLSSIVAALAGLVVLDRLVPGRLTLYSGLVGYLGSIIWLVAMLLRR